MSTVTRRQGRKSVGMVAALAALVLGLVNAPSATAATPGTIATTGPLESIAISSDLNCDVRYVGDSSPEFYGSIACGTLVAVGGTLYGPSYIPAGGSAEPRTAYTPVSQSGPTGAGTLADPFVVTTVVDLGSSGISLTETDTYVAGRQSYTTKVTLTNTSGTEAPAVIYRAGDCYVANSDYGYGETSEGSVACLAPSGRVAKWIPVTTGSNYIEGFYSDVWAAVGSQQPFPNTTRASENIDNGAGLSWSVTLPATGSAVVSHVTAFSKNELDQDRDGDGLLDDWEINGLDTNGDGTPDLDLKAMGASPDHKDLFVEADWMTNPGTCFLWWCSGGHSFAPQKDAMADVRAAFAAAPVSNPDGTSGIRLHIDSGSDAIMNPVNGAKWGARSRANSVGYAHNLGSFSGGNYDWSDFNALKASNFESSRSDVFHYMIFGDTYGGGTSSGIAQVSDANFKGDSFLVTSGGWGGFSRRQESGTFMHEFGHTLGLRHGGGDNQNYKPNFQSIMSYFWQMQGRDLDYSRTALPALDENALDEKVGNAGATGPFAWYCGTTQHQSSTPANVDWNCDGSVSDAPVSTNLNGSGFTGLDVLAGHDDWANLIYDGGAVGAFGLNDLTDQNPPLATSPAQEPEHRELIDLNLAAAPGDATVALPGPNVLFPGVAGQTVRVNVTNVGTAPASYAVTAAGVEGVATSASVADLAPGATVTVGLAVDAAVLVPGTHDLSVTLTPAGSTATVASASAQVLVPNLFDSTVRAQAEQIQAQLQTPQPGLDESVRIAALAVFTQALAQHPGVYSPLSPARILDTRAANGVPGSSPIPAGQQVDVQIAGRGGVPDTGVDSVVLNVTVTGPSSFGYLTVFPTGGARPTASNLNFVTGQTIANQVVAKVGSSGKVSFFTAAGAHVVADVAGYYPAGSAFTGLSPARILDTRAANGVPTTTRVPAGGVAEFVVTGRGGVPASGVGAVVLNLTAAEASSFGYLTAYPAGAERPTASNVNYDAGQSIPGMVIAKVGAGGKVAVYSSAPAHVIADVAGWIPAAADYTGLTPARVLDTRSGLGAPMASVANGVVSLHVAGVGGVPASGVKSVILNVTVTQTTGMGYVTVYPSDVGRPLASNLNYLPGETIANSVIAKVGPDGNVNIYASAGAHVIADVAGYWVQ